MPFLSSTDARRLFRERCNVISVDPNAVKELVLYELTDGTRTSTSLTGTEAYYDGSLFSLRLTHLLAQLGCPSFYVLTVGERHQERDNWKEIMEALLKSVALWEEYISTHAIRLHFLGNMEPLKAKGFGSFLGELRRLEQLSAKNKGMNVYVLVNYSTDWALQAPEWAAAPDANVIVKHTKGQVNEGLWLPGKLNNNSFVYVQQGSCSSTWTDEQLLWFIALCTRSMVLHKGLQYGKNYTEGEIPLIRRLREQEMSFVHKKLAAQGTKRVVMFSHVGPEVYEF